MRDAFDVIAQAVREIIHRIDAPFVAGVMMLGVLDAVEQGIAQPDVGDAMSIFARSVRAPSGNSPAFMRVNRSRFSSTLRLRHGESLPGWSGAPRYASVSSGDKSQTNALPFLISCDGVFVNLVEIIAGVKRLELTRMSDFRLPIAKTGGKIKIPFAVHGLRFRRFALAASSRDGRPPSRR